MTRPRPTASGHPRQLPRRDLIAGGLGLLGLGLGAVRRAAAARIVQPSLFPLGVASGDPAPDGVVLWTRLAADPRAPGDPGGGGGGGGGRPPDDVEVVWEVARDERMTDVVRRGTAVAEAAWGRSVHVEVQGLDPDRWYWYRFRAGAEASAVGRTRTLPAPGADARRLRFAFASCQHYEHGYFTALRAMADDDLDLVFHLGDYIYESARWEGRPRLHPDGELATLDDYRRRYALYRRDPDLQAAHATFPWVVTWDDHEVDNNYAAAVPEDGQPPAAFLRRRAAAYQAYYEHMPLRRTSRPSGPHLPLYRAFAWGRLASFHVLDTRQYRTDQPCGDGRAAPCAGALDPAATLLGDAQERWLFDGLAASPARWHIVPQQVMVARVDRAPGADESLSMDVWTGYEAARRRFLTFLATRRPSNPIVLTGDIHSNWVADLRVDDLDLAAPPIGVELAGTSISSGGDGADTRDWTAGVLSENPGLRFFNGQRGYVRCDLTPAQCRADFQVLDFVTRPGGTISTRASFAVEDGQPGAERV